MKLPWQKSKPNVSLKAAAACLGSALNYLQKPTLGDLSKLDSHSFYIAAAEVVCLLFHLTDRILFDTVPHLRQARMDALVSSGIAVFAEEMRPNLNDPTEANELALQMFMPLYDKRMDEYASLGDDWFRLVLSKFGRHFSEAVNDGELSMEIYLDAQSEVVQMHRALLEFTPELFKP